MTDSKDLSNDEKYLIFQALSHQVRVKILTLLVSSDLSFATLKRELEMDSSGQLQHHLQKLSTLIANQNGSYSLTSTGVRALEIYRESEKSNAPLAKICSLPAPSELADNMKINRTGILLRLSIGSVLSTLTVLIIVNNILPGQSFLKIFNIFGTSLYSWVGDAIVFGFFGLSFLLSSITEHPGCEITSIPNLFIRKKWYCSCVITPFNIPNGQLLQSRKEI